MHGQDFFFQAFVFLAAAVISVPIAKRLGLGSVLGYLAAGVVIGPFGVGLIGSEGQDVMHFAEFGVVLMLFLVGLELDPSRLWRLRGPIVGLGGLQVVLTATVFAALGTFAGAPWRVAIAVGMIFALSSTAIVLQTLEEKGLMQTTAGQSSLSVLLFQDMAVIPMLAILPLLAVAERGGASLVSSHAPGSEGAAWVEGLPGWEQTVLVLGAVVMIVIGGRFLVRPAFRAIAATRLREIFTAGSLLLIIGIALMMERVGLSPALGTFLAGVVLANSEYHYELRSTIEPFKGLLLGVFFIAVGASIDFDQVVSQPELVAQLLVGLIIVKFAILGLLGRFFKMGLDQNLLFAFALAQGSEFAFVLLSFAMQSEILSISVTAPLFVVVALSMALTPLFMIVNEKLVQPRLGTREVETREPDLIDVENPVIIAGFGRFGHVVGRLLSSNGVGATLLDIDSDQVDLLRKLGLRVFYGDASRHDLLQEAGADKAKLLLVATDSPEKSAQVIETARKHFPHLTILARAQGRIDAYELIDAGVTRVYRETLDSSLRMGIDALRLLGFRGHRAYRAARIFRRLDEASVRELADMRHDRTAYISRRRERIRDLEEILQADRKAPPAELDAAWDTDSLRQEFARGADD
jgi:monovalent cation:proton antiporter-2 (CPA2) family protein